MGQQSERDGENTPSNMNGQAVPSTPSQVPPETDENLGLGEALRAIYRQTVDEAIPSEMLDLLKRLG